MKLIPEAAVATRQSSSQKFAILGRLRGKAPLEKKSSLDYLPGIRKMEIKSTKLSEDLQMLPQIA